MGVKFLEKSVTLTLEWLLIVMGDLSDKDTLLLRNAQLFQELESVKRVQADVCTEMEHDSQQKDTVITELERRLQDLQRDVDTHQTRVNW